MRILVYVNEYICVCKVSSNVCGVKEASVAKTTRVGYQGYIVCTFLAQAAEECSLI